MIKIAKVQSTSKAQTILTKKVDTNRGSANDTTSLADLRIARRVPGFDPYGVPMEPTSGVAVANIKGKEKEHSPIQSMSTAEVPHIVKELSVDVSGDTEFQKKSSLQPEIAGGAIQGQANPTSQASGSTQTSKKDAGKVTLKQLTLTDSKWSRVKPSPLRNIIKDSDISVQTQKSNATPLPTTPKVTTPEKHDSDWATPSEIKPKTPNKDDDVVSEGSYSEIPSEAHSSDSASKLMAYGKLFKQPQVTQGNLMNWDGTWASPPEAWDSRPSYNNNDDTFRDHFDNWLTIISAITLSSLQNRDSIISYTRLENADLCPDGIGLVTRDHTIDSENCQKYGYGYAVLVEIKRISNRVSIEDFDDWGKVDMKDEMNAMYNGETTEFLATNYIGHKQLEDDERAITIQQLRQADIKKSHEILAVRQASVKYNICVRPASRADMAQVADIFNYYVSESPRTTELEPVTVQTMEERFYTAFHDKLPFFVAISMRPPVKKGKRGVRGVYSEKILGFVLSQDFSAITLAERYTSELELYVHPEWRHRGVGKSLLDKVLEVCDPGWSPRQGYYFECDQDVAYKYGNGGQRDLANLIFVIRHYNKVLPGDEPDYEWIKEWLAGYGFEEQGCLKNTSVKHGRL